jgi:hypothetical protein
MINVPLAQSGIIVLYCGRSPSVLCGWTFVFFGDISVACWSTFEHELDLQQLYDFVPILVRLVYRFHSNEGT